MKRISVLAPLLALFALAAEAPPLYVGFFGSPNTETFGQTITTALRPYRFAFWINLPAHIGFRGEVREWRNNAAGRLLWASAVMRTLGTGEFERIEFLPSTGTETDPPNVCESGTCVLLITTAGIAQNPGYGAVEVAREDFVGGNFVFRNRRNDGTLGPWITTYLQSGDLRFEVSY